MQLVAYGAQDIYLTGNPQITFFKVVYRRHTNFSMEAIEQTMNGTTSPDTEGQTATCTISRNGDLIHKVYVTTDSLPTATMDSWEGSKLIKEVELEIGGQRIDRHYTEWNQVWEELSTDESKAVALKAMKGDIGNRLSSAHSSSSTGVKHVQIPLNFWFCRNVGLALPLIALQYHEVKLKFTWGIPAATAGYGCNVIVDYIYLDTDERRRFAQVSHEYLIEQIQKFEVSKDSGTAPSANLNFNHPVKELIWTNEPGTEKDDGTSTVQLKLNGHDRFSERKLEYFQLRQPYEYHTAVPRQNLPSAAQLTSNMLTATPTSPGTPQESPAAGLDYTASGITVAGNDVAVAVFDSQTAGTMKTTTGGTPSGSNFGLTALVFPDITSAQVLFPGIIADGKPGVARIYKINFSSSSGVLRQEQFATIQNVVVSNAGGNAGGEFANGSTCVFFDRQLFTGNTDDAGTAPATFVANTVTTSMMDPDADIITQARTSKMTRKINVYSFGLKPEEHQPSGTCNFSRIDSAKLNFKDLSSATDTIQIFAVNYNVLRIMSGMGGLAYSN